MQVLTTGKALYWQGKAGDLMPFLRALAQHHVFLRELLGPNQQFRYLGVRQG